MSLKRISAVNRENVTKTYCADSTAVSRLRGVNTVTTKRMKLHEEKDNEVPLLGVSVYDCLNSRTGLQLEG